MPPTPVDAIRVQIRGSLMDAGVAGTELDEFSMSLGFQLEHNNPVTDWDAVVNEVAADVRDSWVDRWDSEVGGNTVEISGQFPTTVRFNEVRAYHLNENGLTEHLGVAAFSNLRGSSPTPSLPPQCAVAVSLYAYGASQFNSFGRHGRGRFYLPPLAANMDVGGRLSTTIQTRLANWIGDVLNDLENKFISNGVTGDGFLHLVILGNDGVAQQVVRCRVGRIIDTITRRRNKLNEEYTDRVIELE